MLVQTGSSYRFAWGAVVTACAMSLATRLAAAEPQDAAAKRIAGSAISEDYVSGKFAAARRKLDKAIKTCGRNKCSGKVLAELYRDVGVVYLGGLNKPTEGKEALARAVQADPSVQLDPDLSTPEIVAAFKEVGGQVSSAKSKPKPKPEPSDGSQRPSQSSKSKSGRHAVESENVDLEEDAASEEPTDSVAPAEEPRDEGDAHKNWFSLSVQQDFFMHPDSPKVCYGPDYTCFGSGGVEFSGHIDEGSGNRASGGIGIATTRVLLGYDRLFLGRILAGARLGLALGGAPASSVAGKFLPLHLELRGAYFFGESPFASTGFRPYVGLAAGIAEVDAHVAVDYFDNGRRGVLDAWRKTGKAFAALNLGTQIALSKASAITLETRLQLMLGTSGIAPAIAVGYAHGL